MSNPIGLIAGQGKLPLLEAKGIRAAGQSVACIALSGQVDPELPSSCDRFATAGMIRLGRWIRLLRGWGVHEAVMVGTVPKTRMYQRHRYLRHWPDWRAAKLWYRVLRHDKRSQSVLRALADELGQGGIELVDTTRYIQNQMATSGPMTSQRPSADQMADIDFGWPILMGMNELDVGQAIAVKERNVIAVEAIEGTDAMIRRAGELCGSGGWCLLKGPAPSKDLRFDVPTVGLQTIECLARSGARCLALAAGLVIVADKPSVLEAADRAGIAVIGVEPTLRAPPQQVTDSDM